MHEDSLSPTFHACCSFGGVPSSGAQVRVQILDHDETLLSLAPDPVIGDARASLSAWNVIARNAADVRSMSCQEASGSVKKCEYECEHMVSDTSDAFVTRS